MKMLVRLLEIVPEVSNWYYSRLHVLNSEVLISGNFASIQSNKKNEEHTETFFLAKTSFTVCISQKVKTMIFFIISFYFSGGQPWLKNGWLTSLQINFIPFAY